MLQAPRSTAIASSIASPVVISNLGFGKPETIEESYTIDDVLRMTSTYPSHTRLSIPGRPLRVAAPRMPITSPPIVVSTVSCTVTRRPASNSGQYGQSLEK